MVIKVRDIARILDIQNSTVTHWCRERKIKAYQNTMHSDWFIEFEDFVSFLKYNPDLKVRMNTLDLSLPYRVLRDRINSRLSSKEKFLTLTQIADALGVTKQAVWLYVKNGSLIPDEHRTSGNGMLISEKNFNAFLKTLNLSGIKDLEKLKQLRVYIKSQNLQTL